MCKSYFLVNNKSLEVVNNAYQLMVLPVCSVPGGGGGGVVGRN